MNKLFVLLCVFTGTLVTNSHAWDYEGHRLVNEVALSSLPSDFPAFIQSPATQERIAFLAGEPDRWRSSGSLALKHCNGPDHYLDMETLNLFGLKPQDVSHFRYEFAGQLYVARSQHPTNFPAIDPAKNDDHTREIIGFLPWTITEYFEKLKAAFSYLKTFEADGGTAEEISNAQQNIVYLMGVMGHFCGDAGQPLHTTMHHNGWVGDNPNHYAINNTFHSWVDGGYIRTAEIGLKEMKPRIRTAKLFPGVDAQAKHEDIFPNVMDFISAQNKLVEPLYILNKNGDLSDHGEGNSKGRQFITQQLIASGQLLGDLWFSAWQTSTEDHFLKTQLGKRNAPADEHKSHKK